VLSACVIAAVSVGCPERSARSLLGVGWMCHALFDLALGHDSSTCDCRGGTPHCVRVSTSPTGLGCCAALYDRNPLRCRTVEFYRSRTALVTTAKTSFTTPLVR
jgi:hypothetical protein